MLARFKLLLICCAPLILQTGCGDVIGEFQIIPRNTEISVRVINNTDFDVDPGVEFGRSELFLQSLNAGILAPDEVVTFDIDCDDALVLTTTDSAQLGLFTEFVLDPLPLFEIDFDYFCGELIVIEFVGNGQEFDVFVDAGGENIF